jgi:60 kDa SS-A/Ro ribonucleoprotein
MDFTKHFATRLRRLITPQREPIPGSTQGANAAGGYTWAVDAWTRLDRFLILGTEGGTWYTGERALTRENATQIAACVAEDGARVVRRVVEISEAGRAPRNDPALFVLALAAGLGDAATRSASLAALPTVARTGTHLFHWLQYVRAFRGWGRGVRRAVGAWYTHKPAAALAYQILKYPSRDGWTHRDALRLAHPTAPTPSHDLLFRYIAKGPSGVDELPEGDPEVAGRLGAVHALRRATPDVAARIIVEHGLTREMVPTPLLRHAAVWDGLLQAMPLTALIRNLGVMSTVGLLVPGSEAAGTVARRLGDRDAIIRARLHPVVLLIALTTYERGTGRKGSGRWDPVPQVVDALDGAFYLAFANAPTTGKRLLLALDVSGSMGADVSGIQGLSCRAASAAMALVIAATEPRHRLVAFTAGPPRAGDAMRPSPRWTAVHAASRPTALTPLSISPRQRLDDVVRRVTGLPFGGTDCSLPIVEALAHRWPVDAFVVFTDNETWAGPIHPAQALRDYRERMGIPARLVVVGMTSNGFTIADPDDAGMLDVVGFDAATPQVLSDFIA